MNSWHFPFQLLANSICHWTWKKLPRLVSLLVHLNIELDRTSESFHLNHFNSIWPYELVNISIQHMWLCLFYQNKSQDRMIFNNYHLQSTSIHDQCHDSSFMTSLICNVRWNSWDVGTLVIDLWSYGNDNNIKSYFEFNIFFIPTRIAIKSLLSIQQFPCSNSKLDNIEL